MRDAEGRTGVSGRLERWSEGLSDGRKGRGRYARPVIPGLSPEKYQDGEIRGLSRGKSGVAGYQGFIKMAVWLDFNLLFLNGF
uniref:Uncharacterized protein n=1 Tax=Escherichia coli TaxID=562 RepID=A0A3L0WZF1_ECOLX